MTTVDVPGPLLDQLKNFRMSSNTPGIQHRALIIKIEKASLSMSMEEEWQGNEISEMISEDVLPENSPRFVLISYTLHHQEMGRKSFPLILVYWVPRTSSIELGTLYTSALQNFSAKADVGKVIDIRDSEDLNDQSLNKRLLG